MATTAEATGATSEYAPISAQHEALPPRLAVPGAVLAPAVATVEGETRMIDFREQLVELLRPDDEGFDDPPREGLVKVFRPAGCWVYRVDLGQEDEFRRWVADRFRLDELGAMEVTGEFPMLRVVSPLD
jgi:hypothetical protein